ncbi:MAG: S8 family serine peptidase, partial [Actinomycetota bacterium]|nr:S8 family serine peptidase [Actinomycetota bacterium]
VLNGLAVVVPRRDLPKLTAIEGVVRVSPSVAYRSTLDSSPRTIGAPGVWGPRLSTAGNGIKIGIIDDGVDQTHPFFRPTGYRVPAGFPKGQRRFTTAKVIVARAFPPASPRYRFAARPFDHVHSQHGTHVAGIAAGNSGVRAESAPGSPSVSGVAPRAYIGNYKVLTIPTPTFGLDGNSPEIVAGIEAAVRDGMDVINLSLGEPEIEPGSDIVIRALDGAADAGVIPVVAAGNDYEEFGRGSIASPGAAQKAITTAAATKRGVIADFSSSGPTPISLRAKPDVTAPGVAILSSLPRRSGLWEHASGTSMASPHVAGAAALLRERHPQWTVADIKSALVSTGTPVYRTAARKVQVPLTRQGGGMVSLPRADQPLLFTSPVSLSFGLLRRGSTASRAVGLRDAGGGAGPWKVSIQTQSALRRVTVGVPPAAIVPGTLTLTASVGAGAPEQEVAGFVLLQRGVDRRRIPFWFRVSAPALARARPHVLRRTGLHWGNNARAPAVVRWYRYPDRGSSLGIATDLRGPEQVFRFRLRRRVANFGAAVVWRARGVRIAPRIVVAGDEDRLTGFTALPLDLNPYRGAYGVPLPVVAAILPAPRTYDIVFDTPRRSRAGRFRFRFWVGDTAPPRVRLLTRVVRRGGRLVLSVLDRGAGVYPGSIEATVDGRFRASAFSPRRNRAYVSLRGLRRGRHRLTFVVADFQEAKNMENVPAILPNTTRYQTSFVVR